MNKFLQIQLKINAFGFLKLSLVTLAILFAFGTYTRANAESESEMEVISVPSQEAYYTEDKTQSSSSSDRSKLENEKTLGNDRLYVPDSWENSQNANVANSSGPNILNLSAERLLSSRFWL